MINKSQYDSARVSHKLMTASAPAVENGEQNGQSAEERRFDVQHLSPKEVKFRLTSESMQKNPSKVQKWVIQNGLHKGSNVKKGQNGQRQELLMSKVIPPVDIESHIESRPLVVARDAEIG